MYKKILGISVLPILLVLPATAANVTNYADFVTSVKADVEEGQTRITTLDDDIFITAMIAPKNGIINGNGYTLKNYSVSGTPELVGQMGAYEWQYTDDSGEVVKFYTSSSSLSASSHTEIFSDVEMQNSLGTVDYKSGNYFDLAGRGTTTDYALITDDERFVDGVYTATPSSATAKKTYYVVGLENPETGEKVYISKYLTITEQGYTAAEVVANSTSATYYEDYFGENKHSIRVKGATEDGGVYSLTTPDIILLDNDGKVLQKPHKEYVVDGQYIYASPTANIDTVSSVYLNPDLSTSVSVDRTGDTPLFYAKNDSLFVGSSGMDVTMNDIVMSDFIYHGSSNYGAAVTLSWGGNLTINNSTFKNNVNNDPSLGGAISIIGGNLTLNNVSIKDNTGSSAGIGLMVGNKITSTGSIGNKTYNYVIGKAVVRGGDFTNNSSTDSGGAIYVALKNSASATSYGIEALDNELVLDDTLFRGNHSVQVAGAIGNFGKMTIQNGSSFLNNYTEGDGGVMFLGAESSTMITRSQFGGSIDSGNTAGAKGGVIRTRDASEANNVAAKLDILDSNQFMGNSAADGGVLYNNFYSSVTNEDAVTIAGSIFTYNTATNNGGVIFNSGDKDNGGEGSFGKIKIKNSTFVENTAGQFGGAVYNVGDMTITDTRNYRNGGGAFSRNTALKGGAILNKGTLSLDGVTFNGNTATGTGKDAENKEMGGGAIYSDLYTGLTEIKNSVFTGNSSNYIGGAMYVYSGTAEIDNSTFSGNSALWGGAIYTRVRPLDGHQISDLTITNSAFNNNTANGVGAIGVMRKGIITNTNFIGNQATDAEDDGAGALFLGAESYTTLTGGKFTSNTSAAAAGALGTRNYINGDDSAAKLDINGTLFENNSATTTGGAIDNYFYNDAANDGYAKVVNATFTSNSAANGGAIYNHTGSGTDKKVNEQYQIGAMSIENSIFTGNTASVGGGAIYNEGDMFLRGTNVFTNNIADGVANDIKNIGTLDIAEGTTTLSGGITGNGALVLEDTGTLNLETASIKQTYFTLDGVVNAELKGADNYASFDITDAFDGTGTLNLTLKGAGDYQVFANQVFDNEHVNVLSSSIYTYNWNNNYDTLSVVAKSVDEIVENTGVEAETIKPVLTMTNSSSESLQDLANKILEKIDSNSQADKVAAESAVKSVHPETEAVVQSVATSVQTMVGNLAASRMSLTSMGRAGGDIEPTGAGFWANGLYNRSEQDGLFTAYTRGFAIGMDAIFNKVLTLGTGYSYSHSNIGATHRGTNIDSYTMFIYGQYKPNAWYANAVLNYTMSDYTEEGSALGVGIVADYDVRAYGARLATGYDFRNGVTPELGLRYTHIDADDYKNNLGIKNSLKSTDYMALTLGGKYAHNFRTKYRHISLLPEVRGALKYDVLSDEQVAVVTMPGVDSYSLSGERLSRFGVELGLGLTMKYYNADWTLDYDFEVREDYTSHTGRIKWRYNF